MPLMKGNIKEQTIYKHGHYSDVIHSKSNFEEIVAKQEGLVVLDCYATWCGPCKVISPMVDQFSETYSSANFYKMDVDQASELAQELGVRAMPTFMLFKGGERVKEVVGANPQALRAAIESNL
jgi:thioredoxin 1